MANKSMYPTEEQEQITLFNWAAMQSRKYPELKNMFHIPNEGKRSVVAGAHMKAAGMRKGVSDIFLPAPRGKCHGLFIEMKRLYKAGSRPTKDQLEFISDMRAAGYAACVAYGWKMAADAIIEYLGGDNGGK